MRLLIFSDFEPYTYAYTYAYAKFRLRTGDVYGYVYACVCGGACNSRKWMMEPSRQGRVAGLAPVVREEDYLNYAAAQAMDEARHHLAYRRFLEKMEEEVEDIDKPSV